MNANRPLCSSLLSAAAIAGCSADTADSPNGAAPDFTGVWSGALTTHEHEYWQLDDLTACLAGCTPTARAYYASLIDDPANEARSVQELNTLATAFMHEELAKKSLPEGIAIQTATTEATDSDFRCMPYGLARAAVSPLPLEIRREGANLTIAYETWNQSRTIFMDGRSHPANLTPTRLGHSIGRYEGDALVIETKAVEPGLYYKFQSGGGHSAEAVFRERYVAREEPRRLELELTVTDAVTLFEPHVLYKTWLWTPDVQLVEDRCDDARAQSVEGSTLEALRRRRR